MSCAKDEVGGTATQTVAGEWVVTVAAADANGTILYEDEDLYELGQIKIFTYNTAKNVPTEMWIDDNEEFWEFKLVVNLDYGNATFSTDDFVDNEYYNCGVKISNGKISFGAATTPSGMPADKIEFDIVFDDDSYVPAYWHHYYISGYRYTGFAADEPAGH